jgi:hypothetical protein
VKKWFDGYTFDNEVKVAGILRILAEDYVGKNTVNALVRKSDWIRGCAAIPDLVSQAGYS